MQYNYLLFFLTVFVQIYIHGQINGTLTIGLGVTNLAYNMTPTQFFDAVYKTGIDIGGTTYTFPVQFNSSLVNNGGGNYLDNTGTVKSGLDIPFKYTGNDSSNSNMRYSYSLARTQTLTLFNQSGGYADQVKSAIITPQASGNPPDHPLEKILAKRTTQTGPGVRNKINIANA